MPVPALFVKNAWSLGGYNVTRCKSEMWSCIDCECLVPEKEQLPYFKEQVAEWAKKAPMFRACIQSANNFRDISRRFGEIVEMLEEW